MTPKEIVDVMARAWGGKTLAALQRQAAAETNGNAFDALREAGGRRWLLVMCMTRVDQIAKVESLLELPPGGEEMDWEGTTLAEAFARGPMAGTLVCWSLTDGQWRRKAVVLIAADPCSVTRLEEMFNLPR